MDPAEEMLKAWQARLDWWYDAFMITICAVAAGWLALNFVVGYHRWFYRRGYRRGRLEERIQVPDPYVEPISGNTTFRE